MKPRNSDGTIRRRLLSTRQVVFLVLAAAAPMAAMIGNVPLALLRGNGVGLPAAFIAAAAVLLCFAVGYAAMSKRVVNSGAFYTYIARALGKPTGIASAYVAVVGYAALAIGLAASFGYFTMLVLQSEGIDLPWYVYSAVAVTIVAFLGYRSADVSAKVLGVLMFAEFLVLIVFDLLVVGDKGAAAFPLQSFEPAQMFSGSVGIALMFAFTSFVGFESAALYGEETDNPSRTIPRALYISVGTIAVFYVITAWIIIGAAGGTTAPALAQSELGDFVFTLATQFGGETLFSATAVLLCTSLLASFVALHNAASRYLFALGREGVMPESLGKYHPTHLSPHIGSAVMTVLTVIVLVVLGLFGADPYVVIAVSLVGLGTLGIILVQALTALSVLVFFWNRKDRSLWRSVIAPIIGFAGLGSAFVLAALNYDILIGSTDAFMNAVPVLLLVAAVIGAAVTVRLRRTKPAAYAALASSQLRKRTEVVPTSAPVVYTRRYCLVGGGPSSMVMARALVKEGVPFDWYEKHGEFGGIWDMDNPTSPMYESAHFISSKYTSGFYGLPMPQDFPDYPTWRQIRDYIRIFARTYGLYEHITFNTEVTDARLLEGDRWEVTTSAGVTREYDGLICAPGVTWHPSQPRLAGQDGFAGEIRHSVTFRDSMEFRERRVLIVGAGNSGVDIACDAAAQASQAFLSVRRGYRFVPKHIGGLPTDAVLGGLFEAPRVMSLSGNVNELIDAVVGDLTRLGLPAPDHDALASHPIMNTQVLHHLAHGDLIAKPDIDHLTETGVVFSDGSTEEIDFILMATGYEYRIPFINPDLLTWKSGHPQLYLNVYSREVDSLYVLGFIEFADAAYKRFDEMAQLVAMDIRARETGIHREELLALKARDRPDLSGGIDYIDSPRHANYVESHAYQAYLAELRDRFSWNDVDEETFDDLAGANTAASAPHPTAKDVTHAGI
jgi:amino acid transporter